MDIKNPSRSREIAFNALNAFLKEGAFLNSAELDPFAKSLAYGTCQYLLVLDSFIKKNRPKKLKERTLLYLALYERFFMKTPAFAAQNEWIEVSKKVCHPLFVKFFNHYLRNLNSRLEYRRGRRLSLFIKRPVYGRDLFSYESAC